MKKPILTSFAFAVAILLAGFSAEAQTTINYANPTVLTPTVTSTSGSATLAMSAGTYNVGDMVQLTTTVPGGFTVNARYYVVSAAGMSIQLSATPGGTAISATTTINNGTSSMIPSWQSTASWTGGTVPNANTVIANFVNPGSVPTISGNSTIYGLSFSGGANQDLGLAGGGNGTSFGTLTFATSDSTTPIVQQTGGTVRLINLGANGMIKIAGNQGLILRGITGGALSGSGVDAVLASGPSKNLRLTSVDWSGLSGGLSFDKGEINPTASGQLGGNLDLTIGTALTLSSSTVVGLTATTSQTIQNLFGNSLGRIYGGFTLTVGNNNATGGDYGGVIGQSLTGAAAATSINKIGSGTQTISGKLTGTGNVTVNGVSGTLVLSGTANNYSGSTTNTAGTLKTAVANGFGNTTGISLGGSGILALRNDSSVTFGKTTGGAAYTVATTASGPTINVDQNTVAGTGQTFTLGTLTIGSTASTATTTFTGANNTSLILGAVTDTTTVNGTIEFANNIAGGGSLTMPSYTEARTGLPILKFSGTGNTFVTGAIAQNGANPLALLCTDSGGVFLSGNNSYGGDTTVSAGKLALSGGGAIASTPNIVLAGGAVFDVSALGSAFTLGSGQTLSNSTSTAILNGSAATGSGTMSLTYASGTPSFTVTNGTVTLSTSTVFKLNNTGTQLAAGSYKIISKATAGNVGAVAGTAPTVTVGGGGAAAAVRLQIINGELYLVVNHAPVATSLTVTRTAGLSLKVFWSDLTNQWSDTDGDNVMLSGINLSTTNGVTLQTNSLVILYPTNTPNLPDQISYTISDGQGGTATGLINVLINTSVTGTNSIASIMLGATNVVSAYGIPGYIYSLQRATNLAPAIWVSVATNTATAGGVINSADDFSDLGGSPPASAYYRLKWQP